MFNLRKNAWKLYVYLFHIVLTTAECYNKIVEREILYCIKTKVFIYFIIIGTCINNTSVMMFKKGSFEVGGTIYPVAIKVGFDLILPLKSIQSLVEGEKTCTIYMVTYI